MLPSLPSLPLRPEEHAIHKYASKAYMQEDEGYDKWGPPPEGWEAVVQESLGQGRYRKYVKPGSVPGTPRWTGLQSLLTPPWIYVLFAFMTWASMAFPLLMQQSGLINPNAGGGGGGGGGGDSGGGTYWAISQDPAGSMTGPIK